MQDDTPCPQGRDSSIAHKVNEIIQRAVAVPEGAGATTATAPRAGHRPDRLASIDITMTAA